MKSSSILRFDLSRNTSFIISALLFVLACSNEVKKVTDIPEPETVLKLSPSENNPRNSEGDFVTLKDGRILYVYSRYTGDSSSDDAPAFLAGRYSVDGGKTWTSEDKMIIPNEGEMNVMSVSLLPLTKRRNCTVLPSEEFN